MEFLNPSSAYIDLSGLVYYKRQRIDRFAIEKKHHLCQIASPVTCVFIIEARKAGTPALQLVKEISYDLAQWQRTS